jgi:predicted acetyltransferase
MCQLCDLSFVGLAQPQLPMLASYADALRSGWSPNNLQDVSGQQLDAIAAGASAFLASLADAQPPGRTITLPDGTEVPRLPMRLRWIWDGEFCGQISLRWAVDATGRPISELPSHVLGHIGYAVVPWKRGHGLAKKALRHMLSEAREVGLSQLTITTDADNQASQKVVLSQGATLLETFTDPRFGPELRHRYVITLS